MHHRHLLFAVVLALVFGVYGSVAAQDATPTPQPENEAEAPQMEVTEVPQYDAQGYMRVANFSPSAGALDVQLNDEGMAETIEYTMLSAWQVLPAGTQQIVVTSSETGDESLVEMPIDVRDDVWLTVAILDDGISLIEQAMFTDLPSTAQVTFANVLSSGEAVDFTRDDVVFVAGLPVTTREDRLQNSIPVDARTFTYNFGEGGTPDLVTDGESVDTVDTSAYLVASVGTLDDPQLVIDATPNWKIRLLTGDLAAPATLLEAAQAEPLAAPFLAAVEEAGLADLLTQSGPVTVFVPADFVMDDAEGTGDALAATLRHHIVEGNFKAGDLLLEGPTLTTIDGNTLALEVDTVSGAQIIEINKTGSNGTIHIINAVLTPPE